MRILLLPLLMLASVSARSEPVTLSLTEAQKEEMIAANSRTELATPLASPRLTDRRPHGEVGLMLGSGGARGLYGATTVPLGEAGWASFAFESSRNVWPYRY